MLRCVHSFFFSNISIILSFYRGLSFCYSQESQFTGNNMVKNWGINRQRAKIIQQDLGRSIVHTWPYKGIKPPEMDLNTCSMKHYYSSYNLFRSWSAETAEIHFLYLLPFIQMEHSIRCLYSMLNLRTKMVSGVKWFCSIGSFY